MAYKRNTSFTSEKFFAYFWIDEDNMKVQIISVIYEKRDQLHQLSQMDME